MGGATRGESAGLIDRAGVGDTLSLTPGGEEMWIEVIRKMDEVYSDFVESQVEVERQHAELEETHAFIGSVLASMSDVLVACDRRGRIEQTNAALEALVGRGHDELRGLPLVDLLAPASRALVEQLQNRLIDETALTDLDIELLDAAGGVAPLAVNCTARHDHKGRLAGMVLIGRPVGELKRAYAALDRTVKKLSEAQAQLVFSEKMAALGRLVAGVAHELNNPISFVFGNMHALKRYGERLTTYLRAVDRGVPADELAALRERLRIDRIMNDLTPLVDGTLEGAERVSAIVGDLRRFSANQAEPCEDYDLVQVARTAASWVVKAARVKPTVVIEAPESLTVHGRKGPVHQVVVNLVQNAVDVLAGRDSQAIDIRVAADGDGALVEVRDDGPGIPAANLPRIFEPFFTTKPIGQGTGLGLYVSYALAEEQGGRLAVANHAGGGAVFTLHVPLRSPA